MTINHETIVLCEDSNAYCKLRMFSWG